MKTLSTILIAPFLLGCSMLMYSENNYHVNQVQESGTGQVMLYLEIGFKGKAISSPSTPTNHFRRQLIYTGINGKTIQLRYEELYDNVPQDDFTQLVRYDLANGDTFNFRKFKIRVLEANNNFIRFIALAGPNHKIK